MKASHFKARRRQGNGAITTPIHDDATIPPPPGSKLKLPAMHGDHAIGRAWRQKPSLRTFRRIASLKELHHSSVTDLLQR